MGKLTFVGHATVLIEQQGVRVLTDPLLRARIGHVVRRVPVPDPSELGALDAILISHAHADHLDVPSLRRLAHTGPILAPPAAARVLVRAGVPSVIEVNPGERTMVGPIAIEALRADHDGRRFPIGRRVAAVGYLIDGPARVYFAGDTDLFDQMDALRGRVDVALLPVWGWGPRLPAGHLGPETAAQAVELIRPSLAVPIHWGTMRSPGERSARDPRTPAETFATAVERLAPEVEVRILAPGDATELSAPAHSPSA
jgi:L-ascorbate metabolism protein UlaG (beta-lactamase superfamily)